MCEIKDGRRSAILKMNLGCFCNFSQSLWVKGVCVLISDILMKNFVENSDLEI